MKLFTIGLLAIATLFNTAVFAACPNANITLSTQAEVDNFSTDYPGCTDLLRNLKVEGSGITNLDGLGDLTSVFGDFEIKNCPDLVSITGLGNLTTVGAEFEIERCPQLASLDGLESLSSAGDLEIVELDALTDITALSNLTTLTGELKVKDCDALTSLDGLDNLASVGEEVDISLNQNLTDLTALSNLTSVGGNFEIRDNGSLTSLDGLENITSIGGWLHVTQNSLLSDCLGACEMIAATDPLNVQFHNNLPGSPCDDENDLEAECLLALPVELTDFRAVEAKNQTVVVSWGTASELDNKHFEIERAVDGRNFKTIGTVAGNGTTTKAQSYNFVDQQPTSTAYYRLKQVDFSGAFTYSDIALVEMATIETANVTAFPTVAKNEVTIRFTGFEAQSGTYSVFNSQGQLVLREEIDLSNKMAYKSLNIAKFNTGIYTIVINDNTNHVSSNFVIVK